MQRGAIKQHGKFWVLKYREDVLKNGVKVRKDVYKKLAPLSREYQTKESVQALADVILAPLNAGLRQPQSVDTVETFLDSFVAKGEGGRGRALQHSTVTNYKVMLTLVRPHLTDIELRQVRTPYIDKLLRAVAESGDNGMAQTTYRNLKNFLSSAFRYAVRHGLVDFNPVRDAAIPEGMEADTHAYSLQEVVAMEKVMGKVLPVAKTIINLAALTGLGSEEIMGLKWEDYDGKVLSIERAVTMGREKATKNKYRKAPVPTVKTVQIELAKHKARGTGEGYIFQNGSGNFLPIEKLAQSDIRPELAKVGIEWHGWHAFRRGLSSVLHDLGVAELTIKHILRQSDSDVTRKHYIKANVETNRKALQLVEAEYLKLARRK
jgi:integrase